MRYCLFGDQDIDNYLRPLNDYSEYFSNSSFVFADNTILINGFFEKINVNPTHDTIKIAKDFIELYLKYYVRFQNQGEDPFILLTDQIEAWVEIGLKDFQSALNIFETKLDSVETTYMKQKVENRINRGLTDLDKLKQKT